MVAEYLNEVKYRYSDTKHLIFKHAAVDDPYVQFVAPLYFELLKSIKS